MTVLGPMSIALFGPSSIHDLRIRGCIRDRSKPTSSTNRQAVSNTLPVSTIRANTAQAGNHIPPLDPVPHSAGTTRPRLVDPITNGPLLSPTTRCLYLAPTHLPFAARICRLPCHHQTTRPPRAERPSDPGTQYSSIRGLGRTTPHRHTRTSRPDTRPRVRPYIRSTDLRARLRRSHRSATTRRKSARHSRVQALSRLRFRCSAGAVERADIALQTRMLYRLMGGGRYGDPRDWEPIRARRRAGG